jgi:hypothetical protein
VAKRHQLFREVGNNSLGSAVELRRHGLGERSDLRNSHGEASKRRQDACFAVSSDLGWIIGRPPLGGSGFRVRHRRSYVDGVCATEQLGDVNAFSARRSWREPGLLCRASGGFGRSGSATHRCTFVSASRIAQPITAAPTTTMIAKVISCPMLALVGEVRSSVDEAAYYSASLRS